MPRSVELITEPRCRSVTSHSVSPQRSEIKGLEIWDRSRKRLEIRSLRWLDLLRLLLFSPAHRPEQPGQSPISCIHLLLHLPIGGVELVVVVESLLLPLDLPAPIHLLLVPQHPLLVFGSGIGPRLGRRAILEPEAAAPPGFPPCDPLFGASTGPWGGGRWVVVAEDFLTTNMVGWRIYPPRVHGSCAGR